MTMMFSSVILLGAAIIITFSSVLRKPASLAETNETSISIDKVPLDSVVIFAANNFSDCRFCDFDTDAFFRMRLYDHIIVVKDMESLEVFRNLFEREIVAGVLLPDYQMDTYIAMRVYRAHHVDRVAFGGIPPKEVEINGLVYEDIDNEMFIWAYDNVKKRILDWWQEWEGHKMQW